MAIAVVLSAAAVIRLFVAGVAADSARLVGDVALYISLRRSLRVYTRERLYRAAVWIMNNKIALLIFDLK